MGLRVHRRSIHLTLLDNLRGNAASSRSVLLLVTALACHKSTLFHCSRLATPIFVLLVHIGVHVINFCPQAKGIIFDMAAVLGRNDMTPIVFKSRVADVTVNVLSVRLRHHDAVILGCIYLLLDLFIVLGLLVGVVFDRLRVFLFCAKKGNFAVDPISASEKGHISVVCSRLRRLKKVVNLIFVPHSICVDFLARLGPFAEHD